MAMGFDVEEEELDRIKEELHPKPKVLTVAWFSAGVSSAVATKMMIGHIDRILYTHIDDQHDDTMRFVLDCQEWFGKPVEILQSPLKSVEGAIMATATYPSGVYVNGPRGASCTRYLKRQVRQAWEYEQTQPLRYVWGMDVGERERERKGSQLPCRTCSTCSR